jgi:hypothetical protein
MGSAFGTIDSNGFAAYQIGTSKKEHKFDKLFKAMGLFF